MMRLSLRNSVLALALVGAFAAAGAPVMADEPVAELIQKLQSPDYTTRQAATQSLMRLSPEHRSDIETALQHTSNEEAIARLEQVAIHLFMKAQTSFDGKIGLMGVRLSAEAVQVDPKSNTYQTCVVVWKVQPGFPAAEVLQPGDRLIAVNGEKFPFNMSIESFRQMVNGAGGGAVLPFTVIREGKVMDVKVRLAGLGVEDVNALVQVVDARDRAAEEYRQSLKTGRPPSLASHDAPAAGVEKERIDVFVPGGPR